jgi:predicted small secreted protein
MCAGLHEAGFVAAQAFKIKENAIMNIGKRYIWLGAALKLLAASLVCAHLSACNTMAGLGKDVEKLGGSIEKSADKAKK